jgi:hypothetical protein
MKERHRVNEGITYRKALAIICGLAISVSVTRTAEAVEPEKQPIYSNTIGGLLCGSARTSQCKVPAGQRLIIEHVSGYVFESVSPKQTNVLCGALDQPHGAQAGSVAAVGRRNSRPKLGKLAGQGEF